MLSCWIPNTTNLRDFESRWSLQTQQREQRSCNHHSQIGKPIGALQENGASSYKAALRANATGEAQVKGARAWAKGYGHARQGRGERARGKGHVQQRRKGQW